MLLPCLARDAMLEQSKQEKEGKRVMKREGGFWEVRARLEEMNKGKRVVKTKGACREVKARCARVKDA